MNNNWKLLLRMLDQFQKVLYSGLIEIQLDIIQNSYFHSGKHFAISSDCLLYKHDILRNITEKF